VKTHEQPNSLGAVEKKDNFLAGKGRGAGSTGKTKIGQKSGIKTDSVAPAKGLSHVTRKGRGET